MSDSQRCTLKRCLSNDKEDVVVFLSHGLISDIFLTFIREIKIERDVLKNDK